MNQNKEENLVTLAILTFEKAQILRTLLESDGIEVYIHNVNQIQPVISAGVRVRIKESDLPHALRLIEDSKWISDDIPDLSDNDDKPGTVLIPVDFSNYSMKTCEIGFKYAARMNLDVVLFHTYFTSYFPSSIPLNDATFGYEVQDEEALVESMKENNQEMANFCKQIDEKIKKGELPKVNYNSVFREGVAEEEILEYSKETNPEIIVMGTRGKHQKDIDMIGSVTGEVIDNNKKPVLTVPENAPFNDLEDVKNIAFATSFNQKDLLSFDEFMALVKPYDFNIHIINISTSRNQWNEIRLNGMRDYFKKQYPEAKISATVLDDGDLLTAIEKFVKEKNIEAIALCSRRRNILARIFSPGVKHKMFIHTDIPLLVMPVKD
jgi:nucleotide-binding universal stress UspA family protein